MTTAEERIELAKKALVATGYFTEDQVGDDIAPRIIELHAALTQQQQTVYVCTHEPYHDNSVLVGVTDSTEAARELLGYPDPDVWQEGDPTDTASDAPVWYTMAAGEPLPCIARVQVKAGRS